MRPKRPLLEWQIVDQEEGREVMPWPPLIDAPPNRPAADVPPRRFRKVLWGGGVMLIVLGVVTGGWLWQRAEAGLDQVEGELSRIVQVEVDSVALGSDLVAASWNADPNAKIWVGHFKREQSTLQSFLRPSDSPVDPISDPFRELTTEVEAINLREDLVVATFVTLDKDGGKALRQTRFYRETAEGWQRTAPDATLWGSPRTLESAHFVFHFRQNDAEAVRAVAPQIDALYSELLHNFGLRDHMNNLVKGKLVIEVSVERATAVAVPNTPRWESEPLLVPSPALYLAPVELSDEKLLAQSIALTMIEYVIQQATEVHTVPSHWLPLLRGLPLWQLWELEMPLSAWREEVVVWIYGDNPAEGTEQPSALLGSYSALCAMHNLWMLSPLHAGIPLQCRLSDEGAWVSIRSSARAPRVELELLSTSVNDYPHYYDGNGYFLSSIKAVASATLLEYAVATYGHEQLPKLLAALADHEEWDSLVPVVYGISAAEFEEGWRAYLGKEYALQLSPP